MKQIVFHETGKPAQVLKMEETTKPEPKPNEVLIRVTTRNINPSDIMFIQGMYGITPQLPSSAGFEAVGVVEKSDSEENVAAGTRVLFTALGTWKEYVCVPAKLVIPAPSGMSDEIASQAFINPMTAYGMLETSKLEAGDWLLITAGASAFGKLAIQMAKQKGIRVVATVRHDTQIDMLLQLGAELVINTEKEKLQKVVVEKTGEGVHVVFDAVGGALGARALSSLKAGGSMFVFGALSLENMPVNSGLLIFKNLQIKGFWLTTWMESLNPDEKKLAFKNVFSHLLSDKVKVDVAGTYPLEEFTQALEAYEKSGRNGKILLVS